MSDITGIESHRWRLSAILAGICIILLMSLTTNAIQMLYLKQEPEGFEPWLQVLMHVICFDEADSNNTMLLNDR